MTVCFEIFRQKASKIFTWFASFNANCSSSDNCQGLRFPCVAVTNTTTTIQKSANGRKEAILLEEPATEIDKIKMHFLICRVVNTVKCLVTFSVIVFIVLISDTYRIVASGYLVNRFLIDMVIIKR